MPSVSVKSGLLSSSVDIHYETIGTGRPVVLIHGWSLNGAAWQDNVPALEQAGYQAVTYDRRGSASRRSRPRATTTTSWPMIWRRCSTSWTFAT